jgi:5-methylthioadenosine/S-adenosylhomocysteine deaminase
VVVSGGTVDEVRTTAPSTTNLVETGGLVLPGLVDLHGHPEYNVFSAWEPPLLYANRYEWRASPEYAAVVKGPWRLLTEGDGERPSLSPTLTRYAEARALVGGVTALQGASGRYPDPSESLVRNVDRYIFGAQHARSLVDLARATPEQLDQARAGIASGTTRALYVHLAEGTDDASRAELDQLVEVGLLTSATVVIHGTALGEPELRRVADTGAKLVWSPQSNLRLYGRTTDVATALRVGVPVAVGADWLPSGSPSLLDELQVARRVLAAQGAPTDARSLVQMVTANAAGIAGVGEKLGRIRPGLPADLLVLERHHPDPWESVLRSDRRSVGLVTVGGDVAYGRPEWVERLVHPPEVEAVVAWGRPMALSLGYSVLASPTPPPRLADLPAALLGRYAATGPLFA